MKTLSTIFLLLLLSTTVTIGQGVNVTPATGGTDLTPTSPNVSEGWATLGPIVISESNSADFSGSGTLILTAPFNWIFNVSHSITTGVSVNGNPHSDPKLEVSLITVFETAIVFTVTVTGINKIEVVTISGIEVQPILALPPSQGDILSDGTATIFGIDGTTNFGSLSLDGDDPLPVELKSFSAKIMAKSVNLEWTTATEVNNYGFEVLRSTQDDKWDVLGFVEGHGNSNSPKEYNFIDSEVNPAGTYSYRLKQIDNDGSYEFSKTIEVSFDSPISLELSQNYPNPFNPSTTINFSLPQSGNVTLKIFNPLGEEVITLTDGYIDAGVYTFNFNGEGLPSGMYIYQLSTPEKTQTMKMILMK
jgi:hypothetical protein